MTAGSTHNVTVNRRINVSGPNLVVIPHLSFLNLGFHTTSVINGCSQACKKEPPVVEGPYCLLLMNLLHSPASPSQMNWFFMADKLIAHIAGKQNIESTAYKTAAHYDVVMD